MVTLLTQYGGSPALPDDLSHAVPPPAWESNIPGPAELRVILAAHGSPLEDRTPIPRDVYQRMMFRLVQPGIVVEALEALPAGAIAVEPQSLNDATESRAGSCTLVEPDGPDPFVVFGSAGGSTVLAEATGNIRIRLALYRPFPRGAFQEIALSGISAITLPDIGEPWLVRLDVRQPTGVCALL